MTRATLMPPRMLPMRQFAKLTIRREMPPPAIRLPARMKKAMAMMEVDCRPPNTRCAITAGETPRLPRATAAREPMPRDMEMGTPIRTQTAKIRNRIMPAFMITSPPSS